MCKIAMLKYVKRQMRPSPSILSQRDIKAAQKSIADVVSMAAEKSQHRRQYNSYSKEQRAMIGKYAAQRMVPPTRQNTIPQFGELSLQQRGSRKKYLKKLKEEILEQHKKMASR